MLTYAPAVAAYRQGEHLSGRVIHEAPHLTVRINPDLPQGQAVTMFRFVGGPLAVALRPELAATIGIVDAIGADTSEDSVRALLDAHGLSLSNPEYSFYLDVGARAQIEAELDAPHVRLLAPSDAAAFAEFEAANSPDDLDEAYVELDQWVVMAAMDGDRIVAAAGMYPWRGTSLADIGVIVRPDARGAGHARALVRAISREALRRGHEPQYRCDVVNVASQALARSAGFTLYGTWEPLATTDTSA